MFVVDSNNIITFFNPTAEAITKYSTNEVIGKPNKEVVQFAYELDLKKPAYGFIEQTFSTRSHQSMAEQSMVITKQGVAIPVSDSAAPIRDHKGNIGGCVVVFRDATEERKLFRMKNEFISVTSHQLKTPLTNIKWTAEMIAGNQLDDAMRSFVESIQLNTNRLIRLVNELLDISYLDEQQGIKLRKSLCDIVELIKTGVERNRVSADEKRSRS